MVGVGVRLQHRAASTISARPMTPVSQPPHRWWYCARTAPAEDEDLATYGINFPKQDARARDVEVGVRAAWFWDVVALVQVERIGQSVCYYAQRCGGERTR
jgi:hypothetical protein